eukprot:CAMPEP_0197287290 /NCGR_PEP_ID=MMETSP0890-20130614/3512_1 /TAXON_ID=44058 ORGANISM="Aureoumbra lagunensis, Strain CCMP1510" /NCGR_SAMPLE_ID=MMETSP0890 /ASSEMBLY_ACC=CAM_ASM_000533 /LENGTH=725 /DNA_ID=CAMNT_0042756767 /DNA_START=573 /DNA_END=2750 /DNA_ORIENTATION=-
MTSCAENVSTAIIEQSTEEEQIKVREDSQNGIKYEEEDLEKNDDERIPLPPQDDELGGDELCAHWLEKESGNTLPAPSSAVVDQTLSEEPLEHPTEPKCTLKGQANDDGVLSGRWAMTQNAHKDPNQTSRFEYRRSGGAEINTISNQAPHTVATYLSGAYTGHFLLQVPGKLTPVQIDEKTMALEFVVNTAGHFNVRGFGNNKYGNFDIIGTCGADGNDLILYRSYKPIASNTSSAKVQVPPEPGAPPPRKQSGKDLSRVQAALQVASGRSTEKSRTGRSKAKSKRSASTGVASAPKSSKEVVGTASSQRSSVRPRKTPSHLRTVQPDGQRSSAAIIQSLPENMRKCHAIITNVERATGAHWFMTEVDPVALGVLHYRSIVTSPMDLGTVKRRLEEGLITDIYAFTAEMRLIFRNALTFNVLPEAPVHEAARDLLEKFEDAVKNLWKQLSTNGSSGGPGSKKRQRGDHADVDDDSSGGGLSSKRIRNGNKGKSVAVGKKGVKSKRGPRFSDDDEELSRISRLENEGMVPVSEFLKLQKEMRAMQETIDMLQKQAAQTEVQLQTNMEFAVSAAKPSAAARKAAKMKLPLTFEEKQQLSNDINNLPPEKLGHVVKIVQNHMDLSTAGDDEIEIDIEILNTETLRHLQNYVKNALAAAKRKAASGATGSARPSKQSKKIKQEPTSLPPPFPIPSLATAPEPMLEDLALGTHFTDGGDDDDDLAFALDA